MDNNNRTGIEELRRRQAARKDSEQGASGSGNGSHRRGSGWKLAVLPVLAVLIVGAVGFGAYRAGIAGKTDLQPPDDPAGYVTQEPVTPEDSLEQTQEPMQEQTSEPQGTDAPQEEPLEFSEPTEPEVDHTGQMWATLCDGTVVYENDGVSPGKIYVDRYDISEDDPVYKRLDDQLDLSAPGGNTYVCPGGEGNVVSEITLEFPSHIGHEAPDGNQTRSVRYGEGVTASEFLAGTGYSSFEDLKTATYSYGSGVGIVPEFMMKNGLPDTFDLSKPVQAYIDEFWINYAGCKECSASPEWADYCSLHDLSKGGPHAPGLLINGVSAYDLDAVIGVLGMPAYGLRPHFVNPAYFDASDGYFDMYVWDMGESGFLLINFARQELEVDLSVWNW